MKFSERILLHTPKRPIEAHEYEIFARSRYSRQYGRERSDQVIPEHLVRLPEVLQNVGFVAIRNILTPSAAHDARSRSLANKSTVKALYRAWDRIRDDDVPEKPHISVVSTDHSSDWLRFDKPGFHMVVPADTQGTAQITRRWSAARVTLHPSDALAWNQGESYFPSVELNEYYQGRKFGAFVLHESAAYSDLQLAPEIPPVSQ